MSEPVAKRTRFGRKSAEEFSSTDGNVESGQPVDLISSLKHELSIARKALEEKDKSIKLLQVGSVYFIIEF